MPPLSKWGWASSGHIAVYDQWTLRENAAHAPIYDPAKNICETGKEVTVSANGVTYHISKASGNLTQIMTAQGEFLKSPIRPSFFRAITDADAGFVGLMMGKANRPGYFGKISFSGIGRPSHFAVTTNGVKVVHKLKSGIYQCQYTVFEDGSIGIDCSLQTGKNPPARFGMHTELDAKYHCLTWFGKGPHDTYWGRDSSGIVAVHTADVLDQDEYVRPQEHGNKRDVRWLTLTDNNSSGIRIDCVQTPFSTSVWPYSLQELQRAKHVHDLPDHTQTTLNIDCLQNGLGDCFVPCPERYKILPNTEYRLCIRISAI